MSVVRAAAVVLAAAALAGGLVAWYLAAGGADYVPLALRDPCKPRPFRHPKGFERIAEQILLSGLDGAACKLGIPREELALALATDDGRRRLARRRGLDEQEVERLVRDGLKRGVDDANRAGALTVTVLGVRVNASGPLKRAIDIIPLGPLLDRLRTAKRPEDLIPDLGLGSLFG